MDDAEDSCHLKCSACGFESYFDEDANQYWDMSGYVPVRKCRKQVTKYQVTKYIVFKGDNGEVVICSPEDEKETLKYFHLDYDGVAPDGYTRQVINGPYISIMPNLGFSLVR